MGGGLQFALAVDIGSYRTCGLCALLDGREVTITGNWALV